MVKGIFLIYNVILISSYFYADGLFWKTQQISYRNIEKKKCRFDQESCSDGECIDDTLFCDGKVDCRDRSDEGEECKYFRCPRYLYTCKYGACINSDKVCDSKIDCDGDGSDEENCIPSMDPIFLTCDKYHFRCDNGQCIPETDTCDGVANCIDGSDETAEVCKDLKCWPYLFQCDYGACINRDKLCNGIANCVDSSDEAYCSSVISFDYETITKPTYNIITTTQESVISFDFETVTKPTYNIITSTQESVTKINGMDCCRLPEHPENGKWSFLSGYTYNRGALWCGAATIVARCNHGYKMYPDGYAERSICQDSHQDQQLPKCLKTCRSIEVRGGVMDVKCDLHGFQVSCINPNENTRATITYTPFYGDSSIKKQQNLICVDGIWKDLQILPTITNIYPGNNDPQDKLQKPQEILTYYLLNNTANTTTFIIISDQDNLYPFIK